MSNRVKTLAVFLAFLIAAAVIIPQGLTPVKAAGAKAVSSAVAPDDALAVTGAESGDGPIEYKADNDSGKRILVIQTNSPWDTDANERVMKRLVDEGYIQEYTISSVLDSIYMDYTEYNMILIANDQNYENYRNYDKIKVNIEKYVESGGVVLFGACDGGWADGSFTSVLPGDVSKNSVDTEYDPTNYIANEENSFVKGDFYTKSPLTSSMLIGNYCSHVAFKESTLPENAEVILRATNSKAPTLVKYNYGEGTVVASGLTWEFYYNGLGSDGGFGKYYPDIILYALSFSDEIIEKPASEYDSGFQILIDSNNFCHTNQAFTDDGMEVRNVGFMGVKNYKMSDQYFERLVNYSSRGEKSAVKAYMNYGNTGRWSLMKEIFEGGDYWGGSCYGIATSMALVYEKKVKLADINNGNAINYNNMRYPYEDSKLLDTIQYLQVSQMLAKGGKSYAQKAWTVNDTGLKNQEYNYNNLRSFLKSLVAEASSGRVSVLGFSTAKCGHAVLITGCRYDPTAKKYYVKIFDENSVKGLIGAKTKNDVKGKYSEMEISSDYRFFNWRDYKLDNNSYLSMYITNLDLVKRLDGSVLVNALSDIAPVGAATPDEADTSDHTAIICSADDTFKITDSEGRSLVYDENGIRGDMTVYAISTSENILADGTDAPPYITFEVDASYDYTVTDITDTVDVRLYNSDNYVSVEGSNIDSATLSFDDGIGITGENYEFTAFLDTDKDVGNNENRLVSVSAKSTGETKIEIEDNKINAQNDSGITNVMVGEYVGSDYAVAEVNDIDSIDTDSIYEDQSGLVIGDVDGDGAVTVVDATIILRKVADIELPYSFFNRIADADIDNCITLMDATCIQRWMANLTSNDNIGKPVS